MDVAEVLSSSESNPQKALALVRKQLDESSDRVRSLCAEHRLLRHKKYREENILCLHKNPVERSDAQQSRIDNLIASNQSRSVLVTENCKNPGSVLPKNLRRATFSKEADSAADKKSRPIKSSLSKVLDDHLNVEARHPPVSSSSSNNVTGSRTARPSSSSSARRNNATAAALLVNPFQREDKDFANGTEFTPINYYASTARKQHQRAQDGGTQKKKMVPGNVGSHDADNGAFFLQHSWKAVESQYLKKRSTNLVTDDDNNDGNNEMSNNNNKRSDEFENKNPLRHVHLTRTLPDSKDTGKQVAFDRSKKMIPSSTSCKNAAVELIKKHNKLLQSLEESENNGTSTNRNKGYFGAPKSQVLHLVHDEIRHLNNIGSSKRRGPPPSQMASSTTLRQYNEKTKRMASELAARSMNSSRESNNNDSNNKSNNKTHQRTDLATLTLDDLGQGGTSTPRNREERRLKDRFLGGEEMINASKMPSTQIVIDHSKPGPARRYIRSGAYLIADRRRQQWKEADQYFVDSSPAREIPKHKMVSEKGFNLLAARGLANHREYHQSSSKRSEVSELTGDAEEDGKEE